MGQVSLICCVAFALIAWSGCAGPADAPEPTPAATGPADNETPPPPAAPRITLQGHPGKMTVGAQVPVPAPLAGRAPAYWGMALGIPETIGCREKMILNFPEVKIHWTGPDAGGAVACSWTSEGRIRYSARLVGGVDTVDIEMTITNLSNETWHDVWAFNCLNPTSAKPFNDWRLERTYMSEHGVPRLMARTTRVHGHMPTVGFYLNEQTPWGVESPFIRGFAGTSPDRTDDGWIVTLSEPAGAYMAATAPDSLFLFDNLDRCCLHSAPNFGDIAPGESSTTVARLYIAAGALEDFLKRFEADRVTLAARAKWARPHRPRIALEGLAPPAGGFGPLVVAIKADWMAEPVQLRLPETLQSSMGLHFIDHNRRDMPPLAPTPQVQWTDDPRTGEVRYAAKSAEGIAWSARARAYDDEVYLEFTATNGTDKRLDWIVPQVCLSMRGSGDFGKVEDVTDTCAWIDGAFTSLAETTPTAKEKGRAPWLHVQTQAAPEVRGPREFRDGWWIVDQKADVPLIVRLSADKKHLVAMAWDGAMSISTNSRIPCLHSGPPRQALAPGATAVWHGKIYLMGNDPAALKLRYTGDSGAWPYDAPKPTGSTPADAPKGHPEFMPPARGR